MNKGLEKERDEVVFRRVRQFDIVKEFSLFSEGRKLFVPLEGDDEFAPSFAISSARSSTANIAASKVRCLVAKSYLLLSSL